MLVGATTANPFFAVNSALVSRSRVFEFKPLSRRGHQDARPPGARRQASAAWATMRYRRCTTMRWSFWPRSATATPGGRWRRWKSACCRADERPLEFTRELAAESVQRKAIDVRPHGDAHYDAASALDQEHPRQRPRRGLYWLARMLEGGEDVRFLCRRLVILASEDVGNADPHALPLAVAAMQACEFVGLPECQLTLAQGVTYLACAPKTNAATIAIGEARADVRRPPAARARPLARPALRRRQAAGPRRGLRVCPRRRRTASPRRTIWASSASTIGPSIAGFERSWPSGWPRFAKSSVAPAATAAGPRRMNLAQKS